MVHTGKKESHLEKCPTQLRKRDTTQKNRSQLAKKGTLKNGSQLEKWITLRKTGHTKKNGSHLQKMGQTKKMAHT